MTLPGRRVTNLAGGIACAGMMGFALYAQHILFLDPCPLCILQRVVVIALGAVFLAAALHHPGGAGRYVYAGIVGLIALAGIGVAGWHVHLQNMPPAEVPSCGPGLQYMISNFPLGEALSMVFEGSGECAEVVWSFLGLSMPAWVLICLAGMGGIGAWNNLRQQ